MAIYTSHETKFIREATNLFRQRCLMSDGSLFREESKLWTTDNLEALHKAFVDAPDSSDRSFEAKFRDQLANQSSDVQRLAAEVVAVHFLFPTNIGARRKMQLVSDLLGMTGDALPKDHEVSRAFDSGIGSGGPGIHFRRPVEVEFVIEFALAWRKLTPAEAVERLGDPWKFMEFIDEIPGAESAQTRHMLLNLLYPEYFERVASRAEKNRIVRVFEGLAPDESAGVDRRLFTIRQELEKLLPSDLLDFYWSPLVEAWRDESQAEADVSPIDALRHKKQIVLYGPPGTGKTHRAKSIAAQLIRSTALKRWGAARYFREGKELDELILKRIRRLQLHPAYSYEDFVCGLHLVEGGRTQYRPGFLFDLIEEINREPANERLPMCSSWMRSTAPI
jgi:5-methylcytosine-specific restriction protein B